jgi:lysophospholipase L1-like esterase
MLDCLIIGDSIAVGVHHHRAECVAYAKSGINSQNWNQRYLQNNLRAKTVIISLGSNDHAAIRTRAELQRIREKVGMGSRVYWIMPAIKPEIQEIVEQMALDYGDIVVPFFKQLSKDGVHPTGVGYRKLAEETK